MFEKKAAHRLGMLGQLLNKESALSIRNDILLSKQLIRLIVEYACPCLVVRWPHPGKEIASVIIQVS
jgi:hypothetical protein